MQFSFACLNFGVLRSQLLSNELNCRFGKDKSGTGKMVDSLQIIGRLALLAFAAETFIWLWFDTGPSSFMTQMENEIKETFSIVKSAFDIQNNFRRMHHNTPPLIWDIMLADTAIGHATLLAKDYNCEPIEFSGEDENIKENLYAIKFSNELSLENAAVMAVHSWYDEIRNYNYKFPNSSTSKHFTQMIWSGSTKVGFGVARNIKKGCIVIAAHYSPKGNIPSQYEQNVAPFGHLYDFNVNVLN